MALALGLGLAIPSACATPVPNDQSGGAASTATAPTSSASTGPVPQPTGSTREENPGDMTDPRLPGTEKTVRGTVSAGVEANCMLLTTDSGESYLLIGGDRQLIMSGARLEVTGQIQADLMTTCQQGTPFTVATVRKI